MNTAFTAIVLLSLIIMISNNPDTILPTLLGSVNNALLLSLKLLCVYSVWLSVLQMMSATGLDKKISGLIKPLAKRLFPDESDETYTYIALNLSANMLGMGGASTPMGMKAIQSMSNIKDKASKAVTNARDKASHNMRLLLVINATSIQLIPATIIALRASAGSADSADILLPTLIATTVNTTMGILLCKLCKWAQLKLKSQIKNHKTTLNDHKTLFPKHKAPRLARKTNLSTHKTTLNDHKTLFTKHKAPRLAHKTNLSTHETTLNDHKTPATEHKTLPFECKTNLSARKRLSFNRKTQSPQNKTQGQN